VSLIACAVLFCLWGCGCGKEATPVEPDMDALRSLPYAGAADDSIGDKSGVLIHHRDRTWPGWNLVTVQMLAQADLLDMDGAVIRSWRMDRGGRWERACLLPDGGLAVVGVDPVEVSWIPDHARYVARFDAEGSLLWKRPLQAHHDILPVPGDRFMALTYSRKRIPTIDPENDTRDDQVTVLDRKGSVLEEYSLLDSFGSRPDVFRFQGVRPNSLGGRPWIDLFHSNSLVLNDDGRLLLLSFRHQDRIAIMDLDRREVVWSWGGGVLSGPHDAQWLENGNILVFDNGLARGWSRVLELDPDSANIVWEYGDPERNRFFTLSKGSSQRLPNGNTLIADSDNGRAFEVTPQGETVWEFVTPHTVEDGRRAAIVRIRRVPPGSTP
jgi:hypothetical protein